MIHVEPSGEANRIRVIDPYEVLWNGDFSSIAVVAEDATVHDPSAPDGVLHGCDAL